MELDDIIYIVITVVIFIASLIGNKKPKPLPPQEEEEDMNYTLNEFEKILERKEEFVQAQQVNDNEVVQEEHQSVTDEYNNETVTKQFIDNQENIKKEKEHTVYNKSEKEESEEESEDGFDLNSAIIYSSILERKKFRH